MVEYGKSSHAEEKVADFFGLIRGRTKSVCGKRMYVIIS